MKGMTLFPRSEAEERERGCGSRKEQHPGVPTGVEEATHHHPKPSLL